MHFLPDTGTLDLGDQQLEYRWIGPDPSTAPTLVLLHEGLGSAGLGRFSPTGWRLATGLGCSSLTRGLWRSNRSTAPRPLDYMHHEAASVAEGPAGDRVPARLLIGHSDGASIATLYAGNTQDHRVTGLVLIAPHFVERHGAAAIAQAKRRRDLIRQRLARWHKDVDAAFKVERGLA